MRCIPHQTLSDVVKKIEMGRPCSTHGVNEWFVQGFSGEPDGSRPLERPRRR
jgi:hypothetical protein